MTIEDLVKDLYDNVVDSGTEELPDGTIKVIITRGVKLPEIYLQKTLDKVKGLCYTIVKEDKTKPKGKTKK